MPAIAQKWLRMRRKEAGEGGGPSCLGKSCAAGRLTVAENVAGAGLDGLVSTSMGKVSFQGISIVTNPHQRHH